MQEATLPVHYSTSVKVTLNSTKCFSLFYMNVSLTSQIQGFAEGRRGESPLSSPTPSPKACYIEIGIQPIQGISFWWVNQDKDIACLFTQIKCKTCNLCDTVLNKESITTKTLVIKLCVNSNHYHICWLSISSLPFVHCSSETYFTETPFCR